MHTLSVVLVHGQQVAIGSILVEGMAEEGCSIHGIWEMERREEAREKGAWDQRESSG